MALIDPVRPRYAPLVMPSPLSPSRRAHDQHGFRVRLEWGQTGVMVLAAPADLVVIVDVLSFSTAVSVAVERGALVIPYRFQSDTAEVFARSVGATLASADRGGQGPTLSPASLSSLRPGEQLVLPSPNGATCSVLAAERGATVVAGCLRNASAVGRFAAAHGGTTAVIAAGEMWPDGGLRFAVEDLIGAGAVLAHFDPSTMSPEARAAVYVFQAAYGELLAMLKSSASGRELIGAGFGVDVAIASEVDATDLVPLLSGGAFLASLSVEASTAATRFTLGPTARSPRTVLGRRGPVRPLRGRNVRQRQGNLANEPRDRVLGLQPRSMGPSVT